MKSSDMVKRKRHSDLSVNIIATVIDGKIERKRRRGRRCRQLVNDLKDKRRKKKHQFALCRQFALEEATDRS